jgi:hypothetical protein
MVASVKFELSARTDYSRCALTPSGPPFGRSAPLRRCARGYAARPPLRSGPPPLTRRRPSRRGAGLSNRLVVRQGFDMLVSDLVPRGAEEL